MAERKKEPTIAWTETAENQFFEVLDYWTERNNSTSYAEKLSSAVWNRTAFLAKNPLSSVKADFPNTRKAAMGHFSILYRIVEDGILITSFWDNRQDPKKLHRLLKHKRNSGK
ncbi:MAG: type II toxin-antitoxin system RelE/ParE family toxin [Flavobacteriales bacterium]|nr:type II toxin-antitoxin system RelE/ParE family toxin [Flavobacteriales bacterium]